MTENYRLNTVLSAYGAALDRIELAARSGNTQEVLREVERTNDFIVATNGCESDDELSELRRAHGFDD